jgi:hypothetical protein
VTHHQPHYQASTIDLILSSIPDSLRSTTQYGCPGISHHDFVGASFEISHLIHIDQSALVPAAAYLPWDSIGSLTDANMKVLRLNFVLVALLDRFAPLRTYNRREANSLIWFDDAVLSAIQDPNRAYSSYRSSRSTENWDRFRSLRNRATQVIRSAKQCFAGRFLDMSGDSKKLWRNIRSFGMMSGGSDNVAFAFSADEHLFYLSCRWH